MELNKYSNNPPINMKEFRKKYGKKGRLGEMTNSRGIPRMI
jgi:hypothetical protein